LEVKGLENVHLKICISFPDPAIRKGMSGVNRGITHSSRGKSQEAGENLVSGKGSSSNIFIDLPFIVTII
jgi:hypothetical protein